MPVAQGFRNKPRQCTRVHRKPIFVAPSYYTIPIYNSHVNSPQIFTKVNTTSLSNLSLKKNNKIRHFEPDRKQNIKNPKRKQRRRTKPKQNKTKQKNKRNRKEDRKRKRKKKVNKFVKIGFGWEGANKLRNLVL